MLLGRLIFGMFIPFIHLFIIDTIYLFIWVLGSWCEVMRCDGC